MLIAKSGTELPENISKLTLRSGIVSASFLIGYGLIRSIIEVFRQPDAHIGLIGFDTISMGQILCIPMILIGFVIFIYARKTHESIY